MLDPAELYWNGVGSVNDVKANDKEQSSGIATMVIALETGWSDASPVGVMTQQ